MRYFMEDGEPSYDLLRRWNPFCGSTVAYVLGRSQHSIVSFIARTAIDPVSSTGVGWIAQGVNCLVTEEYRIA
jgi:hypothetical protein